MALNLYPPGARRGNKFFVVRGIVRGKIYERSTYTTDYNIALRVKGEFEESIKGSETPADSPKTADPVRSKGATFAEAAKLYIQFRNPSRPDCQRIAAVEREIGTLKIADIRPADLQSMAVRMYPKASNATRNRNALRPAVTIMHHAAESGLCEWLRVKKFKEPRPVTRALTPEQASALIEGTEPGSPERHLLLWLFFQGTRISATLKIEWLPADISAAE